MIMVCNQVRGAGSTALFTYVITGELSDQCSSARRVLFPQYSKLKEADKRSMSQLKYGISNLLLLSL